jgi:hypothetical protein
MDLTADRATALRHLELANGHVAEGVRRVERQAALIAGLERDGHDTVQAKDLLEQLKTTLALQIEHRDRILHELGQRNRIHGRRKDFRGEP